MQKRWVKVAVVIVAVVVVVLIAIPFLINADTFRPRIQTELSSALGRRVTIDHLSLSIFSGGLAAQNISIADDPAFGDSPFIRAQKLDIGVEMAPLIFNKQVHITKLIIDSPSIQLIQNQAGKWNFSSMGSTASRTSTSSSTALPDLTVGELTIKNGSATVSSVPPAARPFVYSNVNADVKSFSFAKSFPFDLSANLPANGTLKLNGTAGPISTKDAADTPFQAAVHIAHLDPVAAGIIEAGKGISMVADIDAQATSNGDTLSSNGKIKAARLQLSRTGAPAPQPVEIDYEATTNLEARTGRLNKLSIRNGSAAATVTGTYRFTPKAILLDLHLSAPNLPVDQLEQLLPAFGVRIPAGSSLHGGTLTANLAVSGPATEATIAGPIEIDNTKLAGFDVGSKIQGLNPFGSTGGGTDIQTLKATVNSTPQQTQVNDIYGNLPQIGTATGSGTVAASGALNFNMVATLTSNNAAGALANQAVNTAVNQVQGIIGGFLHGNSAKPAAQSNANRGIPLTITGTATSPVIRANIRAILK